jgi:pimeloyl-ACP methyl ester carboxylesterase
VLHSSSKNSTVVRSKNRLRLTRAALQTAFVVSEELGAGLAVRLFTSPRRHPRPERERAILASGRPFTVDVQLRSPRWRGELVRVAAWRWGHGPTILLVHGWEGRGAQLGAFVEPLVAAGLSVVAFDAPGHGDSPGHRLYLTDAADAVADVAAAIGPVHGLVAHSFGAAAVLLAHGRNQLDVARNVMIAPNAIIHDVIERFSRVIALDETDRRALEQHLAADSGIGLPSLRLERLAGARSAGLLVVHDRADREVPCAHGEQLAAIWPNAQLHATDGLGHRRILRDADVIARAVAYVQQHTVRPSSDLVREVDRYLDGIRTFGAALDR